MPGTGHAGTSCSEIAPDPIFCCYHGSQDDHNATQNMRPLRHKWNQFHSHICPVHELSMPNRGKLGPSWKADSYPYPSASLNHSLRQGYVGCGWVWMSDAAHRLQAVSLWTPSSLRAGWGDKSCCWCMLMLPMAPIRSSWRPMAGRVQLPPTSCAELDEGKETSVI